MYYENYMNKQASFSSLNHFGLIYGIWTFELDHITYLIQSKGKKRNDQVIHKGKRNTTKILHSCLIFLQWWNEFHNPRQAIMHAVFCKMKMKSGS